MSENIREIIFDTLLILETEDKKSHLLIREVLNKYDYLDARDKAFFKRVTEGTVSSCITLDYCLNRFSKKEISRCKPKVRVILRMSAYQLLFMDHVPDSAVCDEAVKLCRKKSREEFCSFINGILRNLCKEKEKALNFEKIDDTTKRLSVKYSTPEWIVKLFIKEQKDAEGLLKAMSEIKPVCVHICNDTDKEALLIKWEEANIHFKKSEYVDNTYLLSDFEGLEAVPGFLEGKLIVQDESSQLAALSAGFDKKKNAFLIDTCAAPGGKTCFLGALNKTGHILSCDVSDLKVDLINENVERLCLDNVETRVLDATECEEGLINKADIVVADVPCSGLGVLSRKSDLKYKVTPESMKDICDLQKHIILNVSKYVKPGGTLIYSTCTIHKAENEKMVKFILENLPFKGDSLEEYVPKLFKTKRECNYAIQLLPNADHTDGFFIARFIKKQE